MLILTDSLASLSAAIGGGFFGGLLFGYALKKVIKLIAVIVGLFLARLAYLQYQQIASVNWDMVENTISTIANTTPILSMITILKAWQQQT